MELGLTITQVQRLSEPTLTAFCSEKGFSLIERYGKDILKLNDVQLEFLLSEQGAKYVKDNSLKSILEIPFMKDNGLRKIQQYTKKVRYLVGKKVIEFFRCNPNAYPDNFYIKLGEHFLTILRGEKPVFSQELLKMLSGSISSFCESDTYGRCREFARHGFWLQEKREILEKSFIAKYSDSKGDLFLEIKQFQNDASGLERLLILFEVSLKIAPNKRINNPREFLKKCVNEHGPQKTINIIISRLNRVDDGFRAQCMRLANTVNSKSPPGKQQSKKIAPLQRKMSKESEPGDVKEVPFPSM